MSASYTRLFVHLVWSTKLREPFITPAIASRLNGFLSSRCVALKCVALAAGGMEDHVHALVGLHPSVAVAKLVRELKASSAGFVHRAFGQPQFEWQTGYGAFTLRETEVELVRRYILDQRRHHTEGSTVLDWELDSPPIIPP